MAISILVNRSSLTFSVLIPLGLSSLCVASPSYAAIINGGFETGDFTEWTIIGNTTIETAEFGSGPTEGTYEALVTNSSGSIAVPDLETFLGLELGSLNDLGNGITYNGSAIKQTFTANAGDVLTLDWNFLKKEEPDPIFNDFAFVSLNSLSTLASPLESSLVPFSNLEKQFDRQTKFQNFSFRIPNTGTYTLGLGVANVTDTSGDSGLLVDNVSLEPIPEPSSVLGTLTLGALGAGLLLKRKHKSVK
jgi:hypothetical protein